MSTPRPDPGRAPSATLPLRDLVFAAVTFFLAAAAIPVLAGELAGHYYHPRLVALTHAVTLGWITLTIMGATYQLVPIVLERPIWSERAARWQFLVLAAGVTGTVGHLALGRRAGLLWVAGLVALGVALHLMNVGLSLRGLARWTFTARLLALGLAGLGLTAVFGLVLAADRVWKFLPGAFFPTLHAHFHLALLGWVMPVVLGIAARVYPMFMLAAEPAGWPGRVQLWGLTAGAPLVVSGLLALPGLVPVGALAVGAAACGHAFWVLEIARARRRPALDWGLRLVLWAPGFLLLATALGLTLAFDLAGGPRWALAYAVVSLGGWVSLTIAGMMFKIVPFLVWYRVFAPRAGREPVPTLTELTWPAAEGAAAWLLGGGILALAVAVLRGDATWIRASGGVVTLGALAFLASLARVLQHLAPCAARRRPVGIAAP